MPTKSRVASFEVINSSLNIFDSRWIRSRIINDGQQEEQHPGASIEVWQSSLSKTITTWACIPLHDLTLSTGWTVNRHISSLLPRVALTRFSTLRKRLRHEHQFFCWFFSSFFIFQRKKQNKTLVPMSCCSYSWAAAHWFCSLLRDIIVT